jgi:membrane protein implicated in regulation of membrane protease activity
MERVDRIQGWAADTSRPLGVIPIVFAAICAAVFATVFDGMPLLPAVAWVVFAALALVLVIRGIRWASHQLEAAKIEHQMDVILERQPRLVPLFRPSEHWARLKDTDYHKAS